MVVESPLECRPPGWLSVSPFPSGRRLVVFVAGEADWATAAQLRDQLVATLAYGPRSLILDLTELGFCNLSGLDVLHEVIEVAQQAGIDVTMRGMSRQLTWLHRTFPARPRNGGQQGGLPVGTPHPRAPSEDVRVVSLV